MEIQEFIDQLEQTIFRYDLLEHPFYQAWSRGQLTLEDLGDYAQDYYHQVESFPRYLLRFASRLERGELRAAVIANLRDEVGTSARRSRADLWFDFVEGVGAERPLAGHKPSSQIFDLVLFFEQMAKQGSREEILAAFYAYESQVPRVSWQTWRGLTEKYGASERTCGYFILHTTADVYHSRVWLDQLEKHIRDHPERSYAALEAAEAVVRALWNALDGIEARRFRRLRRAAPSAPLAGSHELSQ
jgi:pyrroloquinoline-quinone synthase